MADKFPKIADEILGVHDVERAWYWCVNAMVSTDFQGQGIASAMFDLAFKEVYLRLDRVVFASETIGNRLRKWECRLDCLLLT